MFGRDRGETPISIPRSRENHVRGSRHNYLDHQRMRNPAADCRDRHRVVSSGRIRTARSGRRYRRRIGSGVTTRRTKSNRNQEAQPCTPVASTFRRNPKQQQAGQSQSTTGEPTLSIPLEQRILRHWDRSADGDRRAGKLRRIRRQSQRGRRQRTSYIGRRCGAGEPNRAT